MSRFDHKDLQRFAVATIGGLLLGTVAVAAPAPAADTAPLTAAAWQANVEQQIDRNLRLPPEALAAGEHAIATVSVQFDTGGRFDGVRVVRSTGLARLDREALRTARRIVYPALPVEMRGRERKVAMQLYFGQPSDIADMARQQNAAQSAALDAKRSSEQASAAVAGGPRG